MMEEFASETDSDYTSYWRDWVGSRISFRDLVSAGVSALLIAGDILSFLELLCGPHCWHHIIYLHIGVQQPCHGRDGCFTRAGLANGSGELGTRCSAVRRDIWSAA